MSAQETLRAPFPWFGGKSRAADLIWPRFGDVPNYVEPFAGSLAVLLGRPTAPGDVLEWCLANGANPMLRIALCGYENEGHDVLVEHGWDVHAWKAKGGYGVQGVADNENARRERIWFSPACIPKNQLRLL